MGMYPLGLAMVPALAQQCYSRSKLFRNSVVQAKCGCNAEFTFQFRPRQPVHLINAFG